MDALEYDDTAEDANPAGALEEILESPERLKDLDLDAFAEELERQVNMSTDASLTADPGVTSSIPARSHTFVEIDHEIISTVILLPSAVSFKKGSCQLQAKVCARSTG